MEFPADFLSLGRGSVIQSNFRSAKEIKKGSILFLNLVNFVSDLE